MELIAEGPGGTSRQPVHEGRVVRLGRSPRATPTELDVDPWALPGEPRLSRVHAEIRRRGDRVEVKRLDGARNPLFFRGEPRDFFEVGLDDRFVVGRTTIRLVENRFELASDEPEAAEVMGFTLDEVRRAPFRDADQRLEVLSELPNVIRGAVDERDLFSRLVLLLLEGLPRAEAAAIVRRSETEAGGFEVCHWDRRREAVGEFRPSRRLILDAVERRHHSVRTFWGHGGGADAVDYTVSANLDWAFCTPVPGEACAGWGLYVAGRTPGLADDDMDLRPDLKFAELMADVLGALRDAQQLQQRQLTLSRFFSPLALPVLMRSPREALEPRETPVSVMFCDLRGFSRAAERSSGELLELLRRVGQALDVMTEAIHAHHGVIGDFQGDAALAFWGWPLGSGDSVVAACQAALDIRRRFADAASREGDPLSNFRCGIGIASGEAVVGLLGTRRQSKIGVFGPVVNLAARLEGITKKLEVPILVDEATADHLATLDAAPSFRRLARVRPYGLESSLTVCELLPDSGAGALDGEHLDRYAQALAAFDAGQWEEAFALLHEVPHWDRGKDFLTSYILRHRREPPLGWDGVIPLDSK